MLQVMIRVNRLMHDSLDALSRSDMRAGQTITAIRPIPTIDDRLAVAALAIDAESGTALRDENGLVRDETRMRTASIGITRVADAEYVLAFRPFLGLRGLYVANKRMEFSERVSRMELAFAPTQHDAFPWTQLSFFSARNPHHTIEGFSATGSNVDVLADMAPFLDVFASGYIRSIAPIVKTGIMASNV